MISIVNKKDVNFLVNNFFIFSNIYQQFGIPPNWQRPQGFETLVLLILEQQVSLASAKAHFKKLKSYAKNISPEKLIQLTDTEFRDNHISRQKTTYIKALSSAILNKELHLDTLSNLKEAEILEKLTAIKGIGNWTANVYLMSSLQHKDIFPIGDIALFNTLKKITGLTNKEEMLELSKDWKPFRSLSTYFFLASLPLYKGT